MIFVLNLEYRLNVKALLKINQRRKRQGCYLFFNREHGDEMHLCLDGKTPTRFPNKTEISLTTEALELESS